MPTREKPILMSALMVRAILDGRKTQTRRMVKGVVEQPGAYSAGAWERGEMPKCPYGQPGDRLWVREEHFRFGHWEMIPGVKTKGGRQKWRFVADDGFVRFADEPDAPKSFRKGRHHKDPATPAWHKRLARFMPRKFSRITLEITGVRVERLHDISEADAIAEGVTIKTDAKIASHYLKGEHGPAQLEYFALWEAINGAGSWAKNPWVWMIEFKRVCPTHP